MRNKRQAFVNSIKTNVIITKESLNKTITDIFNGVSDNSTINIPITSDANLINLVNNTINDNGGEYELTNGIINVNSRNPTFIIYKNISTDNSTNLIEITSTKIDNNISLILQGKDVKINYKFFDKINFITSETVYLSLYNYGSINLEFSITPPVCTNSNGVTINPFILGGKHHGIFSFEYSFGLNNKKWMISSKVYEYLEVVDNDNAYILTFTELYNITKEENGIITPKTWTEVYNEIGGTVKSVSNQYFNNVKLEYNGLYPDGLKIKYRTKENTFHSIFYNVNDKKIKFDNITENIQFFTSDTNTEIYPFSSGVLNIAKTVVFKINIGNILWYFEFNNYSYTANQRSLIFSGFIKIIKNIDSEDATTYYNFDNFASSVTSTTSTDNYYRITSGYPNGPIDLEYLEVCDNYKYTSLTSITSYEVI